MTTLDPFTYFTVVPSDTQQEWRLRPFEGADGVSGATPFTHEPSLSIADADPPANSNADRPWVLRSRLTLRGGGREASFHLDRSLTSELRVGGERFVFFRNNGGIHGIHVFVKHGFYTGPPGPPPDPWWPSAQPPAGVLGLSFRQQRSTEGQVRAKPSAESREKDECVALARIGQCSRHAAIASAYLLEADGLEMVSECSP
jgi:hypothetical protein